ncbi:MAG: MarR family transcriptional regulator [Acidimicrobiales bacterium]
MPEAVPCPDDVLSVWADFLRAHATITDVLGRELAEATGLPLSWYDVLTQLQSVPDGRLRMQELAAAVVLSKSGLTRLVDRLEREGLVQRTSCPSDRRGTFAAITPAGTVALSAARPVHLDGVARHFGSHLTGDQVATLSVAMRALLAGHQDLPNIGCCGDEQR